MWRPAAAVATVAALLGAAGAASGVQASPARVGTPSATAGCASLANVKSFLGHAVMTFSNKATGVETGGLKGGTDTITLSRRATNLSVKLTAKKVLRGTIGAGIVVFTGTTNGGSIAIHDTQIVTDGGGKIAKKRELVAEHAHPRFVSASLFFDTVRCKYQLLVSFAARKGSVSGAAYGEQEPVPTDLLLDGGAGPNAYHTCPFNPLLTGKACYGFAGGYAVDFAELLQCKRYPPGNCHESKSQPLGEASFNWVLKPTYATTK